MVTLTATDNRSALLTSIGLTLIALCVGVVSYALLRLPYDQSGAVLVGPLLLLAAIPAAQRAARTSGDGGLAWILVIGLAVKLLASTVRWLVAFDLYDGVADAASYDGVGSQLATQIRSGDLDLRVGAEIPGTGSLQIVTGVVYAIIGPSILGGFFVFSALAYYGQYLLYRAFRIGYPSGDHRRYAYFVLLFPSMLYWPSSIGKEAWILVGLGMSALGLAKLLARKAGGLIAIFTGLLAIALVRPHIAILFIASVLPAYLWPRGRLNSMPLRQWVLWGFTAALIVIASLILLGRVQEQFGIEGLSQADTAFEETSRRTSQGGSSFDPIEVRSPADLPQSLVTVLFRPFPFEAHNLQTLIASAETSLLLVLVVFSWRRIVRLPGFALGQPYVRFATFMTLLSAVAFSYMGNFGVLARQRVQYLPFFLVLLAVPVATRISSGQGSSLRSSA